MISFIFEAFELIGFWVMYIILVVVMGTVLFKLATLGAVGFLAVYIVLGLISGTATLSTLAKLTFVYITTGKGSKFDLPDYVLTALTHYLLWPFVLCYFVLAKAIPTILVTVVYPTFVKCILFISRCIPTAKSGKKE